MESWENKIISDKIDGLQQLPAGYSPDLSSKWEIIEAGLPLKKNSTIPLLVRWSVAAAIIVGILLTGIKLNENKKPQNGMMASVNMPSLHIPLFIQKERVATVTKFVIVENNGLKKQVKPVPASNVEVVVKQNIQQLTNDELKINPIDLVTDSADISANELAIVKPQPETPKRVKRRAFQKDFNDGILVMDTSYSKPANQQFGFKLQIHSSTGDDAQPSRRLQLKQVL